MAKRTKAAAIIAPNNPLPPGSSLSPGHEEILHQLELKDRILSLTRRLVAHRAAEAGGPPPAPSGPPMTDREMEVFDFIRSHGPKTGKEIATHFGIEPKSVDRTLKALKGRGVKNRRGVGYYLDSESSRGNA